MNTHALTFLWTPWSLASSILLVLVAAGLCFFAWRRSGYRTSLGLLELLRLMLVIVAAVLLNQPEVVHEYRPKEKPSIAVLYDASPSMETRDATLYSSAKSGTASNVPVTRREAVAPMVDAAFWKELEKRFEVVVQPFSGSGGHNTDLYAPLAAAPNKFKNLVGIVLISDGDWNAGQPPVEAATLLRMKSVPVMSVPVGKPERLPDIEVRSVDAPTFAVMGKSVRVPFTIESSLPRDYVTTVVLHAHRAEKKYPRKCASRPWALPTIGWLGSPERLGDVTLTLEVPPHHDEILTDNNRMSVPVSVRQEKLRVLVVESYPRWEYRYLRNALSPRSRHRPVVLVVPIRPEQSGRREQGLHQAIPGRARRTLSFRRCLPGRCRRGRRSAHQRAVRWLKGLVEHQASGIVFMPGAMGWSFRY